MTNGKLTGRVAIVTGSGRGIGRAIALKLSSEGAKVVVNDIDNDAAVGVVHEIEASGGAALACVGSVKEHKFADQLMKETLNHFGQLDIVVNNAGYTWDAVIQKMTDEQWDDIMDLHVGAPFRLLRAASDFFRSASKAEAAEGREVFRKVVNISSLSGLYGNAGQVNYSAAKAAIVGLTRALAKEWGRYKVNVNCVAFGLVHTRLTQQLDGANAQIDVDGKTLRVGMQKDFMESFEKMIPLGRGATPDEAADAVYLMCCPESNYVSGQVLMATGGLIY